MSTATAWVEKRDSHFVFRWRTPDGRKATHSPDTPITSKERAKSALAEWVAKMPAPIAAPRLGEGQRPAEVHTYPTLLKLWDEANATSSERYRKELRGYVEALAVLTKTKRPADLTPAIVETWAAKRGEAGTESAKRAILAFVRWANRIHKQGVSADTIDALGVSQTDVSDAELMTPTQFAETWAVAVSQGPQMVALAHMLSVYGWRPVTCVFMAVRDIDFGRFRAVLRHVKGRKRKGVSKYKPFKPFLRPETLALLKPLTLDRDGKPRPGDAPLFLDQRGIPWVDRESGAMPNWYKYFCKDLAPECGGIYAWKRYAITNMARGIGWPRPMTVEEIRQITGHKTASQVLRYIKTNAEDLASLMGLTADQARAGRDEEADAAEGAA